MSTLKEIRGQTIRSLSSDPSPVTTGDMWYNSTTKKLKGVQSVTAWSSGGNMGTARRQLASAVAGTQTASLAFGGSPNGVTTTEEYGGTS